MAAPRKPTDKLAANGAFDKNPARAEGRDIPKDTDLLPADALDSEIEPVRKAWAEIQLYTERGLLLRKYFTAIREYARLLARSNEGKITCPERAHLFKYQAEFGGTPKARNYVSVPTEEKENKFGEL